MAVEDQWMHTFSYRCTSSLVTARRNAKVLGIGIFSQRSLSSRAVKWTKSDDFQIQGPNLPNAHVDPLTAAGIYPMTILSVTRNL